MLVASIVRLTLGLKDHRVVATEMVGNELHFHLDAKRHGKLRCRLCDERRHSKDKLITVLAFWSRHLPWEQVARLFGVSWNTVRSAVEAAVAYGRSQETFEGIRYIGIDEISRKRGHVYHTVVYDLDRKRLIWTGAHRDKDSLREFFEWLGPERTALIEGVCCDMWQNYIDVVHEYCGEAVVVFDKFHIIRHLIEAVDQVRRMEARALEEAGFILGPRLELSNRLSPSL
jgi:transposase